MEKSKKQAASGDSVFKKVKEEKKRVERKRENWAASVSPLSFLRSEKPAG